MGKVGETGDLQQEVEALRRRLAQLERQRAAAESGLAGTLDNMLEGLQVIGFDWRYLYVNAAAARHGRKSKRELIGRTMMECYPGIDETEMFEKLRHCMSRREFVRMENRFSFPDGSSGWFELHIEPAPEGAIVLSLDVTEHKRLEEQLRHSQKMEAIGRLAGGIAHDMNNMLTGILSFASFARDQVEADTDLAQDIDEVLRSAEGAASMTRHLLSFSRRRVLQPCVLPANALASAVEPMLTRMLGEDVDLSIVPSPESWRVCVDPSLMEQVLVNLGINARDAMPDGGKLTIEVVNVSLDSRYTETRTDMPPGHYVMLAVSDNGTGMPADVRRRIFEPFFTTKEDRGGTGLGLATSYGIVRQSGGDILCYSEPGRGSTFKVYLPRTTAIEDSPSEVERPRGRPQGGPETILAVDDDPVVRAAVARTLRRLGYAVLVADSVEDAEAVAHGHEGAIHLLVTDVVLAEGTGRDLARRLHRDRPSMSTLFVSGYADAAILRHGVLEPGTEFLQKPFAPDTLARRVREILGEEPPE